MDGNRDVLELLDMLYAMVTDAWSVPLGNDKCIIEREKAVALINDIKASLPSSVAEPPALTQPPNSSGARSISQASSTSFSCEGLLTPVTGTVWNG